MSDVMPVETLPELWQEILNRQWHYMEAEESLQKMEERKKLEGYLKAFLYLVPPDRKFFLMETAVVLKKSICELKEFSANKAMCAFESISQYANNLISKPWRKEFRILKMYSGFFQHEIRSSLLDAEKLFIAMGYRHLSDDTLILDGPICPDQVSNVSRDAMIAYVELQIMKSIHMALGVNDMQISWRDILCYREKFIGNVTQAVLDLMRCLEDKRYRNREKTLMNDNYGYIDVQQAPYNYPSPQKCQCSAQQQYHHQPPVSRHRYASTNGPCCIHEFPRNNSAAQMFGSYPAHNYHNHLQDGGMAGDMSSHLPHMSHSRSLEHYGESAHLQQHNMLPHRHSFDHQQQGCTAPVHHQRQQRLPQAHYRYAGQSLFDPTYECIDENSLGGGSVISYSAVAAAAGGSADGISGNSAANYSLNSSTYANPYNVSGNRIPLPLNISSKLSAYDNNVTHMGIDPTYARMLDNQMYTQIPKMPNNYMVTGGGGSGGGANLYAQVKPPPLGAKDGMNRQNAFMPEHLIDFEASGVPPAPLEAQFDPYQSQYDVAKGRRMVNKVNEDASSNNYSSRRDASTGGGGGGVGKPKISDDTYVYAQPIPKEYRQTSKNGQNSMTRKASYTSGERAGDTTDFSYESANDEFNNLSRQQRHHSPTQFSKNQDGVGSYESWNYVFQNLQRYPEDVGEDTLVKSLHLDSLQIANDSTTPSQSSSADKRRPPETGQPAGQVKQKSRMFEAVNEKANNSATNQGSNAARTQKQPMDNNKQKIKSALKQNSATGSNKKPLNTAKGNDNKTKANSYSNNDNNNSRGIGKATKKASSASNRVQAESPATAAASAQIVVTGANEWSCQFCTFINPNTRRICEMCAKSKDYNLDASPSAAAAAAGASATSSSSVAHNTPTCV